MQKRNLLMQAAVAGALATAASSAMAGNMVSAAVKYASEDITAASNVFIPAGVIKYQAAATNFVIGDLITFTMGSGATFTGSTPPSATCAPAVCTLLLFSATSSTATYQITSATTSTATITLGSFSITNTNLGASTISSVDNCATAGANVLKISVSGSVSANSETFPTGAAASTAVASSCSATTFSILNNFANTGTLGVGAFSDIATSGKNFLANPNSTATVAEIGTYQQTFSTWKRATDATTDNASGVTTLTLSGNLANITGFDIRSNVCNSAAASASKFTGTVTATSATITAAAVNNALYNVCITANGTGVLSGVNNALTLTGSAAMAGTVAGTDAVPSGLSPAYGSLAYNGGFIRANYVVGGAAGGYTNYIRLANTGGATANVYLAVQTDAGSVLTASLGTMAANTARLVSANDINAAVGATPLAAATDRAVITIFMTGGGISGGNMVFNPNGTLAGIP